MMAKANKQQSQTKRASSSGPVLTKQDLIRRIRLHMQEIASFGVKRIGIFGSWATGKFHQDSDIDFVVEFESGKATFKNVTAVVDFLEGLSGREVDILTPEGIDAIRLPHVRERIKRQILYV